MLKNNTNTEEDLWNTNWKDGVVPNNYLISDSRFRIPPRSMDCPKPRKN